MVSYDYNQTMPSVNQNGSRSMTAVRQFHYAAGCSIVLQTLHHAAECSIVLQTFIMPRDAPSCSRRFIMPRGVPSCCRRFIMPHVSHPDAGAAGWNYIRRRQWQLQILKRGDTDLKKILTIQDISCMGKCSLTVALPIISAMGVETVILPTAVLSTHTMFKGYTCKDLSDQLVPIAEHWKKEHVVFDAIYTGYLGTVEEIDTVKKLISDFRTPDTLVFVDPAMADNGRLYPAFDMHYARKNAQLCAIADVIVPNITEACFLTNTLYKETYDEACIRDLLAKLTELGSKVVALTGVSLSEGKTGVYGYDTIKKEYFQYQNNKVNASFHGTGDIFSSVVVGALANGISWQESLRIAADYVAHTIEVTMNDPDKPFYGVDFELTIPDLIRELPGKSSPPSFRP